jgi:hypothetical protein
MQSLSFWLYLGLGAIFWLPVHAQYVPNATLVRSLDNFHDKIRFKKYYQY